MHYLRRIGLKSVQYESSSIFLVGSLTRERPRKCELMMCSIRGRQLYLFIFFLMRQRDHGIFISIVKMLQHRVRHLQFVRLCLMKDAAYVCTYNYNIPDCVAPSVAHYWQNKYLIISQRAREDAKQGMAVNHRNTVSR